MARSKVVLVVVVVAAAVVVIVEVSEDEPVLEPKGLVVLQCGVFPLS